MGAAPVVVNGSVKADGSLELDEKVRLPAGRVQVTVWPVVGLAPGQENWWECLLRGRAELEASGHHFRTTEEIEAEREDFRAGDDRIEKLYEEIERRPERPEKEGC